MERRTFREDARRFAVALSIAIPAVLWLSINLGRVWTRGDALSVLAMYLMMVLGVMTVLPIWAWSRRRRRVQRPLNTASDPAADDPGPAMPDPEPPSEPNVFSLRRPTPLQRHMRLSTRFRRTPPRPRRRI